MQALNNAQGVTKNDTIIFCFHGYTLIACISAEDMDDSTGKDTALTTIPQTAAAPTPASPLEPSV